MKSTLLFALLLTVATVILTGCTTVPRDNVQDTSVRRDVTATSSTYSK